MKTKLLMCALICASLSCKKFVEIPAPKNSIVPSRVFQSDALATSAVLGIYQQMSASGYASGDQGSLSTLCGLTADEYIGYSANLQPIFQNQIYPEDGTFGQIWGQLYNRIYDANSVLEGLSAENGVSPPVKARLQGEALFIRAFNYFYLINLYGEVPLHLHTDYTINRKAAKTPAAIIYEQIIKDLNTAESLIEDEYVTTERVRPNKAAVRALLARTYFYLGNWTQAEKYASQIIERGNVYQLTALASVFLKDSREAIWQLTPTAGSNTPAGNFLIFDGAPTFVSLSPEFVNRSFEEGDLRTAAWIKDTNAKSINYYYPYKYKIKSSTTVSEYSMVFRLAEQYLIRAEARAHLDKIPGAIEDLDLIRQRAGLASIKNLYPQIQKTDLIHEICNERFHELFSEWGDRWFDLKRTGKSSQVLSNVKPNWKPHFVLFPIPVAEIQSNSKITQNEGY